MNREHREHTTHYTILSTASQCSHLHRLRYKRSFFMFACLVRGWGTHSMFHGSKSCVGARFEW
jgi:hypothetical protein